MLSVTDNGDLGLMGNEENARARMQRSALDLFNEHGFERTTTAQIAARAGVTERTYFRHFADKREVLFDGQEILREALTAAITDAPATLGPFDAMFHAFHSVVPTLEANRSFAEPRQKVIAATPALQEREMAKLAALADALADSLQSRGVADPKATLAARTGMTAFAHAATAWLGDATVSLGERLELDHSILKEMISD
ncbi:TetR family transcriptional regulator [Sphingomonas koreensis]|nr:TetR family transcriptional regulator [Sphingomonas koreensis]